MGGELALRPKRSAQAQIATDGATCATRRGAGVTGLGCGAGAALLRRYPHSTRPNRQPLRKLLGIRRRSQMDKGELPTRSAEGITWKVVTDTQEMTTRSGHYTALLETIGARGATKLHADEREQLLAVADALLFGDPDCEQGLARALDLIARLRESERWSAESCAELREHLYGCGPLAAGA